MRIQPNFQPAATKRYPLYAVAKQEGLTDVAYRQALEEMPQPARSSMAGTQSHFVARIQELIEANMTDEYYGIDQLCRDAGASRSQIHNKLKKWTGLSTSHFVRSIKLQRAKSLLVQTDLNVTQVAFEVGFRDTSYFTRVFDECFGICPKNFRKHWQVVAR